MVKIFTFIAALAGISSFVNCKPTDSVSITIKNRCSHKLQLYQLTNDVSYGHSVHIPKHASTTISVPSNWGGRLWARKDCDSKDDCYPGAPASLAEFLLAGTYGLDYYDISFVDGYNFPMEISPNTGKADDGAHCGAPSCLQLPECHSKFQVKNENGHVIGCQSSCAATGDCNENEDTKHVKSQCPDVYTYPTDDPTSMFACYPGTGYTVTFC